MDPPQSLAELQANVSKPGRGYDIHHVIERASALEDGYFLERVNRPDNLVRIPRIKHWEINGWYQTENPIFGNLTPRDYLRHKDWGERERVGMIALRQFGVLKP